MENPENANIMISRIDRHPLMLARVCYLTDCERKRTLFVMSTERYPSQSDLHTITICGARPWNI